MQVLDDLRLGIHHKVNGDAPRHPPQSVRRRVRDGEVESCAMSECQSEPRRHSLRGARERNSSLPLNASVVITHLAQVLLICVERLKGIFPKH